MGKSASKIVSVDYRAMKWRCEPLAIQNLRVFGFADILHIVYNRPNAESLETMQSFAINALITQLNWAAFGFPDLLQ